MKPGHLDVITPEGFAGVLADEEDGSAARFDFQYDLRAPSDAAVSLTMPVRRQAYAVSEIPPVFQMNLPEGYLLQQLRNRLAKTTGANPLMLLALLGTEASIGRLQFRSSEIERAQASGQGERLADLLAYKGAEGLFDSLVDRYLMTASLSGVQPKVLVPEASSSGMSPKFKGAARTSDFIVKAGLDEFPGLATNEYLCMSAAKAAGISVPEFFLSDDRSLFVMRRFDRGPQGEAIGFEDMAVLAGKGADQKYTGRYEDVARSIRSFAAPEHTARALRQLFDTVALSCIVGNGDAHLKNFGMLYEGGEGRNVRMSPAFDIVCTTCYIENDSLALTIEGNKSIFAAKLGLRSLGADCGLSMREVPSRVLELCDAVATTLRAHAELAAGVPGLPDALAKGIKQFRAAFKPSTAAKKASRS